MSLERINSTWHRESQIQSPFMCLLPRHGVLGLCGVPDSSWPLPSVSHYSCSPTSSFLPATALCLHLCPSAITLLPQPQGRDSAHPTQASLFHFFSWVYHEEIMVINQKTHMILMVHVPHKILSIIKTFPADFF